MRARQIDDGWMVFRARNDYVSTRMSPLAGETLPANLLVESPELIATYCALRPEMSDAAQRVAFGTSGHRGSSFDGSVNEVHVLAISQAICEQRESKGIDAPLFLGFDSHALSAPAVARALEAPAANEVQTLIAAGDEYTPTRAISPAVLAHKRGRKGALPTVSLSRPRTILPPPVASNITHRTVVRRIPTSANGSSNLRMR